MPVTAIFGCALLGAGTVALLVPLILRLARRQRLGLRRDFHHTHTAPVPRVGGLALVAAFLVVELFVALFLPQYRCNVPGRFLVIVTSLAMFAVGFWEDLQPLGAKRKLLAQGLIAFCVYQAGLGIDSLKSPFSDRIIELGGWGCLLTILWLVGITNLLNLIDGVDGLASGIALMLMALLVYVGFQNGTFVFVTAGAAGALLAFLCFNFPPARIYLGDGGAYLVGFQIAIFSLVGSHKGTVAAALLAPLLVLALPIVDTSLAILRRGFRGLPLFRPDRQHIHHRLLATGMSRRQVILSLYAVTLLFLALGYATCWSRGNLAPVMFGVAVLILLLCAGKLSFAREWLAVRRNLGNWLALRQEVQYAVCLCNWLRHEGGRCASLEDLFGDLVFAGRRLGFESIELQLADGRRGWSQPPSGQRASFRHQFDCADFGLLTLQAPALPVPSAAACLRDGRVMVLPRELTGHETGLREIMAELLVESWVTAARQCATELPLRFDAPSSSAHGGPPRMRARTNHRTNVSSPRYLPPAVDTGGKEHGGPVRGAALCELERHVPANL